MLTLLEKLKRKSGFNKNRYYTGDTNNPTKNLFEEFHPGVWRIKVIPIIKNDSFIFQELIVQQMEKIKSEGGIIEPLIGPFMSLEFAKSLMGAYRKELKDNAIELATN